MNTIQLALGGQIYNGDGEAYAWPNKDVVKDWTSSECLPKGRGDVRESLKWPAKGPIVYSITYLDGFGFVYAATIPIPKDARGGYADLWLLLGDKVPANGELMANTLRQLLDFFLSKERVEKEQFDAETKEKLGDLEKCLISVKVNNSPFSDDKKAVDDKNTGYAYRTFSDDEVLHKILCFPIQIAYKNYSRIYIIPKEFQPEQTEVAFVNENVKRLISIVCPHDGEVETDKKTVLEEDTFVITYKKNGFAPKKQQTKAYASNTQLYGFDEKTNVITIKSYAELGKKEPFYKQVRFITKMEDEAEPIKERPRVFVNGVPLHHDPDKGEYVVNENGKEVTYYYYDLANGNSKITLDFDAPYGRVDIKLNTEENLKQGAENCQYEGDGRYAYTVVLQPKRKEIKLMVDFSGKTRKGKVSVKIGSDLDEPLSYFEEESTILVDGKKPTKKKNPWIWRIVFLLLGIALGTAGMFFGPKLFNKKSNVHEKMKTAFSGKNVEKPDENKYPKYAQYYDDITSDYSTFLQKVGDSIGTLFNDNKDMRALYKTIDSLSKMDAKVCEAFFNNAIQKKQTLQLADLNDNAKKKMEDVDERWFDEDKKLFDNNAQSVKVLAFKSSKGKQLTRNLQEAKEWKGFKEAIEAINTCLELKGKNVAWDSLTNRLSHIEANSKIDSLVMKRFAGDEFLFAEAADEVYLIATTDKWLKKELVSEKYITDFWKDLRDKNWSKLLGYESLFINMEWNNLYNIAKEGRSNERIDTAIESFLLNLKNTSGGSSKVNDTTGGGSTVGQP